MRLAALCLVIFFVVANATTTKTPQKRQIHNYYSPYYKPNIVEHQRFLKRWTTVTITKIMPAIYTITCTQSTTACTSSSSTTSTTPSSTTSTSSTATSSNTSSITSSTSSSTLGRRRREIDYTDVEAEDWTNEQLSIVPSNVKGVEATEAPVREGRSTLPQLLEMMSSFGYDYHPQEIQLGFDSDPSLALPYYDGSFVQPAAITQQQPRIFFGALNNLFPIFAVTKTETVTSVTIIASTFTMRPSCSTPGSGFLQCAT